MTDIVWGVHSEHAQNARWKIWHDCSKFQTKIGSFVPSRRSYGYRLMVTNVSGFFRQQIFSSLLVWSISVFAP